LVLRPGEGRRQLGSDAAPRPVELVHRWAAARLMRCLPVLVAALGASAGVAAAPPDIAIPLNGSAQMALLVADSVPAAPPAVVGGAPLEGVSAALAAADSAAVRAPILRSGPPRRCSTASPTMAT